MERSVYHYHAFGLQIHSELPLPELLPAAPGPADVTIRYGETPAALPDPSVKHGIWEAKPGMFLLNVAHIAKYLILDGQEIRIQPVAKSTEDDIRAFLVGSAFAALLQQRRILTLHASAIQTQRGAVLFLGRSGSGKSTLLAALLQRGYAMLADDVSAIMLDADGRPLALPAFPHVRLWHDTAAKLRDADSNRRRVRAELEKYLIPVDNFCHDPLPVSTIFVLTSHNKMHLRHNRVEDVDRFRWLYQYTYRKRFLRGLALEPIHFMAATAVANHVEMVHVTRPLHPFLLDELVELVEQKI